MDRFSLDSRDIDQRKRFIVDTRTRIQSIRRAIDHPNTHEKMEQDKRKVSLQLNQMLFSLDTLYTVNTSRLKVVVQALILSGASGAAQDLRGNLIIDDEKNEQQVCKLFASIGASQ